MHRRGLEPFLSAHARDEEPDHQDPLAIIPVADMWELKRGNFNLSGRICRVI
jgi:hypothetical protein